MQIPLIKGIIGVKTNPHIDSPIKNEISININVEDMEETNVSNKLLDKLSLKCLLILKYSYQLILLALHLKIFR